MNLFSVLVLTLSLLVFSPNTLFADEDQPAETEKSKWHDNIQSNYELSDEQMQNLEDSGLNHSQQSKAAHLANISDKSLDEVLSMRTEQKMGWGKIAKEIGVHPSEIGKGTSKLRREFKSEHRAAKLEHKAEKRADKFERKAARRANRGKAKGKGKGKGK